MKKRTDWFVVVVLLSIMGILLLCLPMLVHADEMEVWITSGFKSFHTHERTRHYRENNSGGGVELVLSDSKALYLGTYMNSLGYPSTYIGVAYQPWHPLPVEGLKVGFIGVLATGYVKDGSAVFVPVPTLTYEKRGFGINFMVVPTVVTSVQLKMRFY